MNIINYQDRDLSMYKQMLAPKPKIQPKLEPNRFFTPIPDNREQILNIIKKDLTVFPNRK